MFRNRDVRATLLGCGTVGIRRTLAFLASTVFIASLGAAQNSGSSAVVSFSITGVVGLVDPNPAGQADLVAVMPHQQKLTAITVPPGYSDATIPMHHPFLRFPSGMIFHGTGECGKMTVKTVGGIGGAGVEYVLLDERPALVGSTLTLTYPLGSSDELPGDSPADPFRTFAADSPNVLFDMALNGDPTAAKITQTDSNHVAASWHLGTVALGILSGRSGEEVTKMESFAAGAPNPYPVTPWIQEVSFLKSMTVNDTITLNVASIDPKSACNILMTVTAAHTVIEIGNTDDSYYGYIPPKRSPQVWDTHFELYYQMGDGVLSSSTRIPHIDVKHSPAGMNCPPVHMY